MESIIQPIPFTHYYVPDAVPGNEQNRQDYNVLKLNSRRKPIKKEITKYDNPIYYYVL